MSPYFGLIIRLGQPGTVTLLSIRRSLSRTMGNLRLRRHSDDLSSGVALALISDPDPTFHFDADPDPSFQIKAQSLGKVYK
jgi:hypothetical protein